MRLKTLDDFDFRGKSVLLRSDLNSEVTDGKVIFGDRIIESAETIKELKTGGARVVVLAHQSQKGKKDFISLKQHAKLLNKFVKIKFVDDILGGRALAEISKLRNGEALLLDNVRFVKDEFKPSLRNKLVRKFAPLSDIYINDAFSVCHRKQTSIVSFPKVLPSGIGRLMERELRSLDRISKMKNCLFILGGEKFEDELKLFNAKRKILTTGIIALVFLKAKGYKLGMQDNLLKGKTKLLRKIKRVSKCAVTPIDFGVNFNGGRKNILLVELPVRHEILDIGLKTIEFYVSEIKKAKCIFMKGPAGHTGYEEFSLGTRRLLEAIFESKAFSVLSGGHLNSARRKFKISKDEFDYVSLAGGALVSYLAGEKLPGLEALKKGRRQKK